MLFQNLLDVVVAGFLKLLYRNVSLIVYLINLPDRVAKLVKIHCLLIIIENSNLSLLSHNRFWYLHKRV